MDTNNPQMNALPQILALPRWGFEVPLVYTARGGYVPLPPVCKRMGIAVARQIQRLQDDSFYAPWIERLPVKTSQGMRDTYCIHRRRLPMWLANINTRRTSPDVKDDIDGYKEDLADEAERLFYGVVDSVPSAELVPFEQGRRIRELHEAHTVHGLFLERRIGDLEVDISELRDDMVDLQTGVAPVTEIGDETPVFDIQIPLSDGTGRRVSLRLAVVRAILLGEQNRNK